MYLHTGKQIKTIREHVKEMLNVIKICPKHKKEHDTCEKYTNALICCLNIVLLHFVLASVVVRVCSFFYQKGNNLPNKCFIVTYLQKYWSEIKDERGIKNNNTTKKNNKMNRLLFDSRDFSEGFFFVLM